jgi:hypothetical protein
MPRHLWTILCERAAIDPDTNNVTLIEIIEDVTVDVETNQDLTKPLSKSIVLPTSWMIVAAYERDDMTKGEKVDGELQLVSPAGVKFGGASFSIDLSEHLRIHYLLKMVGFPVSEQGRHIIKTIVKSSAGAELFTTDLALDVRFKHKD